MDFTLEGEERVEKGGIYQELVNFDEMYDGLTFAPIFGNDFDISTQEGTEALNDLIFTKYDGDSLNVIPTCDEGCGFLQGGSELHAICPICQTACEVPTDKPLKSILWIRSPADIRALVNPAIWTILSKQLTTSKFNILEWLTDVNYNPDAKEPDLLYKLEAGLEAAGIKRGYNNFVDNFDRIMQLIYDVRIIVPLMRREIEPLLKENRDKIFCQQLPIPSKVSFVIESNQDVNYYDKNICQAVGALRTIVSIEQGMRPAKGARREGLVVQAMSSLAEYYHGFHSDILGQKSGLARQNIFGSRVAFSARAVITSIPHPSDYDVIYTPWALTLQLLKLHLTNKLWSPPYNFNPIQIDRILKEAAYRYNPMLHDIIRVLIAESPLGKLPVIFQRNPTLRPGSGQLLYIPDVKTDPADISISMSNNVLAACTADFDGDEMNLILILEERIYRQLLNLEPHQYAYDLNRPHQIASYLNLQGPTVATLNNYFQRNRQTR